MPKCKLEEKYQKQIGRHSGRLNIADIGIA